MPCLDFLEWGNTYGGVGTGGWEGSPMEWGKGVKLAKIEVLMEVVVKNDENSKC